MKRSNLALGLCVVGLAVWSIGCGAKDAGKAPMKSDSASAGDDHAHAEGPHEGAIAAWGDGQFNVEFIVDHDKKEATLYVLGGDLKTPAPIATDKVILVIKEPAMTVECKPAPLEGEADGKASRFVGSNDGLGTVREFEGTISGVVDGKPYSGDFHEHAHVGHDHK